MIHLRRYFRLLPAIVVSGMALLAIKGVDLARAAQSAAFDAPDSRGLAPSEAGGAKPVGDLATDDGIAASAAEVDVLSSLTRRREQLDMRERALNMRENLLAASEGRIDQKVASLKSLQSQIQTLLTQRDAAQDKQIASLVKTYSAMKPKDAAHIFDALADEVLLPVAKGMKSDALAPVLGAMNRDAAQHLTVKLAAWLKLPETPPSDCPTMHAMMPEPSSDTPPPVPGSTASVAPPAAAPLQTAAIASPQSSSPAALQAAVPPAAPLPSAQAAIAPPPKPHKRVAHQPPKPVATESGPPAAPVTATTALPAKAAAEPNVAPVTLGSSAATAPAKPQSATISHPLPSEAAPAATASPAATLPAGTTPGASAPPARLTPLSAKSG